MHVYLTLNYVNPLVKRGFTLIEIMLVLLLLGVMLRIGLPYMNSLRPDQEKKTFIQALNVCVAQAWHTALQTHYPQQIIFDLQKKNITLQALNVDFTPQKKPLALALPGFLSSSGIKIPSRFVIQEFFVEGKNLMARADKQVQTAWFYLSADGLAQEVIINILDMSAANDNKAEAQKISLVLNPFKAQFSSYDTFQKP